MNKPYIIIATNELDETDLLKLDETIRNTFVSKKIQDTTIIICAQKGENSLDIFNKLNTILEDKIRILVVPFKYFYGSLESEIWDWMKECFPESGIKVEE